MNRALPVAAAAGALVVATTGAALAAVGSRQLSHQAELAQARTAALAAGRQIAVDIASYDYRHIDADFTRVSKEATGKFLTDFSTQSAGVRDAIVAAKAVSTAQIASAGVVNASTGSVQVVVALNRTVTNVQAPKGTNSAFGIQMFLVKRGGHWLASQVNPL
jgi:Mce-associated membrane protein